MVTVVDGSTVVSAAVLNAYKTEIDALLARSVLAGTGLSGGGTLAADRTLALDISGLTALGAAVDPAADYLPIYDGSGNVVRKVLAGALVPLSAKGDLLTHDGTTPVRLAVGSDGQVLTAQADGSAAWEALPASGAMQKIETKSGAAASYSFSSIPGTYRSLKLVWSARGDTAATNAALYLAFNSDSSGNYDYSRIILNGTNFSFSAGAVNAAYIDIGAMAAASTGSGRSGSGIITIQDYAGTTLFKGVTAECGARLGNAAGDQWQFRISGEWRNTAAINRIDITPSAGSFAAGSVATLYGLT